MSYFHNLWSGRRDSRTDHEKAWRRSQATTWDAKWHALSREARTAYLTQIKAPTKEGSFTTSFTSVDKVPANAVKELVAAGFIKVEAGVGKRSGRIEALSAAYDFSSRIRSLHRYHLLGATNRDNLTKYIKHAFYNQGELVINRVLAQAKVEDMCQLDEGLELYVTTARWPDWALVSTESKVARPLLEALRKAPGPVALVELPGLMKGAKAQDVSEALTELIVNLAVFEDLKPGTLDIMVGLLPAVRDGLAASKESRHRPPLVVCEEPKDAGPIGGLALNDLRVFLLEVAGESPRVRQDGRIFQKEEDRFLDALPPRAGWLDEALKTSPEGRLELAHANAVSFGFVEVEAEDKAAWLRLSGKGRNWLSSGLEDQYVKIFDSIKAAPKKVDPWSYDVNYGDTRFFGIAVNVFDTGKGKSHYYSAYSEVKPEEREKLRDAIRKAFETLEVGTFYRWDSVLDHLAFGKFNPLLQGSNPSKLAIYLDQVPVSRLPERQELAARKVLEAFAWKRLMPFDAFQPAIDDRGQLCIARLPRFEGYFGRPYDPGTGPVDTSTRVIVQPDFSIVVIGMDPAPAVELAPFCVRVSGHAGHGVLTYKITRDSVIRATIQGLTASAILARLKKHASVDVPENILKEVRDWAEWVRLVNVRPVTVVRCPDREAVVRIVSALGKKVERLGDTLVALHVPKLSTADRQKLQEQGIVVTKDDILPPQETATSAETSSPAKKRGRPKKVW